MPKGTVKWFNREKGLRLKGQETGWLYSPSRREEQFSETGLPALPYSQQLILYAVAAAV